MDGIMWVRASHMGLVVRWLSTNVEIMLLMSAVKCSFVSELPHSVQFPVRSGF